MTYNLFIQHSNRNPEDYENLGIVNINNAIKHFNDFDWKKEFKEIEKREEQSLTSAYPEFLLVNTETNERLSILGTYIEEYEVTYEKEGKIGSEHISENITRNPTGNSVQDIIIALFQQELNAKYDYQGCEKKENIVNLGKYNPFRYKFPYIIFSVPVLLFISLLLFSKTNEETTKYVGYIVLLYSVFNFPFILILTQYLSKPRVESATIDKNAKSLQINYFNNSIKIERANILLCTFSFCKNTNVPWQNYAGVSITLKTKEQHFLTTVSFSIEQLETIIETLNINTYKFDSALPFLKTKDYLKKTEISSIDKAKKEDLETLYSNYSDKQLKDIVINPDEYQPEAVDIAKKEMMKRKNKNFC